MSISPAVPDLTPQMSPMEMFAQGMVSIKDALSEDAWKFAEEMLRSCLKEDKVGRWQEVRKAGELRLYCKGIQQLFYDGATHWFYPLETGQVSFDLPRHRGVFDITSPHKRSFVSILSENPPGVNFIPNDLQKGNDVTAAKLAEKMRSKVDRMVSMKDKQAKASGLLCTDGSVVSWVRADANGNPVITMHGVLEAKRPLYVAEKEDWTYCVLSSEVNVWKAKMENPDFSEDIEATDDAASSEGNYERYARLSMLQRNGDSDKFTGLVTEHWCWCSPARFLKANKVIRGEFNQFFPDGVKIHAYGKTIVDLVPENMDALAVEHATDGEGQARPALLTGMTYLQNAYNDFRNQQREAADYSIPRTWVNGNAIDSEGIAEQETRYGVVHVINPPSTMTVQDCFGVEPPVEVPASVTSLLPELKADAEFLTGDFPSLYGGDTPGQDTVGVNKLLNNQAKGQLGPAWAAIQRLWAKVYPPAIKIIAQSNQGKTMALSGAHGQESFDPSLILDGEWGCHPDQDSSFPETTADKRASLQAVLGQLGSAGDSGLKIVLQPDNLKLIKQYSGLTDLIIPEAEARDKQLEEIEQMLKEPPIPDQQGYEQAMQQYQQTPPQPGQPVPPQPDPTQFMKPSVPIDPVWDYHQYEYDKVQEWLTSQAARDAAQTNPDGVQNVKLHGVAHGKALADAQKPQMAKPPNISITAQVSDPRTVAQILQLDGIQANPDDLAEAMVPDLQKKAADTQNAAAGAQHKAVLAAKEAVEPVRTSFNPQPPSQAKDKSNG